MKIFALFVFVSFAGFAQNNYNLIPLPKEVVPQTDQFLVKKSTTIGYSNAYFAPVANLLKEYLQGAKHVVGIQANVWTEYMTYPRALALSEIAWSAKESKNYADFKKRLTGHLPAMDAQKINYSKAFLSQP